MSQIRSKLSEMFVVPYGNICFWYYCCDQTAATCETVTNCVQEVLSYFVGLMFFLVFFAGLNISEASARLFMLCRLFGQIFLEAEDLLVLY